jgi:TetR/AcrR family transcriptional regulator, fatty acid biosynthesis regulator
MVLRAKPDKKEEKDRVREELLRAALRLGAVHGFSSLGLREVAREADIAPTSFYRHFEDMEALGLSLIRDKIEPLLAEWVEALDRTDDEPVELVDAMFQSVDRDPELARFMVAERVGSSAVLRGALRDVLRVLGEPLFGGLAATKRPRALLDAADLVVVLLLDAVAQVLDCTAEARPTLRQRTLHRLANAIAAARAQGRRP